MAAPKTENKAIDDQPKPGAEFKVHLDVGLAHFKATSHDPNALGVITGVMNGLGSWSTHHTDHDGNTNEITHGAKKQAAQAAHKDISGGHSIERVAGGTHEQKGNGSNEENGEAKTEAVNGTVQKASAASSKDMSKGGNGQHHHKGDMTFSVEEGGIHYNVSKEFTVTSTGKLIHFDSKGDISFSTSVNETHETEGNLSFKTTKNESHKTTGNLTHNTSGKTSIDTLGATRIFSIGDINIISQGSITLTVGSSSIKITQTGIKIDAIKVDITS